jgi:prophage antirepressor-like protein
MQGMLNLVYKDESDARAVRVVMQGGEPWFVLADICAVLTIANSRDTATRIAPEDLGVGLTDTNAGMRQVQIVNESGLYSVILGARNNPKTKPFKDWVTRELLPTIRKTGAYSINPTPELPTSPAQVALQMAQALVDIEARAERVEARTDSLEQNLAKHVARQKIDHAQTKTIHTLVGRLAREIGYSRAWRMFKDRFVLVAYRDLLESEFSEAQEFLELQIRAYAGQQERLVTA